MTIDRALSGTPFSIDQFRCHLAAISLQKFRPEQHTEQWSALNPLSLLIFKALFISICHQFNWDFLQNALAQWLLPEPEKRLDELKTVTSRDVKRLLAAYPKPDRIRGEERATMLRRTADELQSLLCAGQLQELLLRRRLEGPRGFYDIMRSVSAFAEDEIGKKVRVLAHDLHREKILVFVDPQNLRPAVEYHIIRLYIRSGRVYPTDESVRQQLRGSEEWPRARLVKVLRRAVEDAMSLTAFYAGMDVATLNYVEWQIGRAICEHDTPSCSTKSSEVLPADIEAISPFSCPFSSFCRSFTEPQYGWYQEPRFQKAIY